MKIDAVITDLELQVESITGPNGHFILFRFIDTYPSFPKVRKYLNDLGDHKDILIINYEYTFERITENTDIQGLDVTIH